MSDERVEPQGWVKINVEMASTEIVSGSGFPKEHQGEATGDFPFAKVGDISRVFRAKQKNISSAGHFISEKVRSEIKARIFPKGAIVFPKIGEALKGNYRVVTSREMLFDNNVMGIIPDTKLISGDFFYYFLTTQDFGKYAVATAVPSVRRGDIASISFSLPPLLEQHRIVAKIEELFSELDKGIENLKTARAQLKVYRQALLRHAFEGKLTVQWRKENQGKLETADALLKRIQQERAQRYQQQLADWEGSGKQGSKPKAPKPLPPLTVEELAELPELPEGWGCIQIGNLLDVVSGNTPKGIETTKGTEIPYYRVSDMNRDGNEVSMNTSATYLSENEAAEIGLTIYPVGTIIFPKRGGAIATNKKRRLARRSCFDLNLMGLTNLSDSLSAGYLWLWILSLDLASISDGSNVPQINNRNVEPLAFPICSFEEQALIVELAEARLSEADQLELTIANSLQQAEVLRQSILKRAFSGQLVPQDPHDEPASALLARIKAERATDEKSSAVRTRDRQAGGE